MPYRINPITGDFNIVSISSATNPLLYNGGTGVISMLVANGSQDGYLAFTDWISFTAKQNPISVTNVGTSGVATLVGTTLNIPGYTLAGLGGLSLTALSASTPLIYNNLTGAFSITQASAINSGYLSFTDWSTFNGKQNTLTLLTAGSSGSSTLVGSTLTVPTYTLAGLGGISLSALSATSPMTYNNGTGTFAMPVATAIANGYLSSANWTTFNAKEPGITAGTTLQYWRGDKTFQTLNTTAVVEATNLYYTDARARLAIGLTVTGTSGAATYSSLTGTLNVPTYSLSGLGGVPTTRTITINGTSFDLSANRSWTVGSVTSVAALTLGTTGADVSSTVATGTTTPVITLNIPTASGSARGALSSTDWTSFNSKQNPISLTTSGTTGAATFIGNTLNIPQYAGTTYTFNAPLVNAAGSVSIGIATGTTNGYLSSTDWLIFNGKGNAVTTNPLSQFAATTSAQLAGVITDETGTGSLVFSNTPTFQTPILGNATATTLTARILPRVYSIVSSATPAVNTDLYDAVSITALATGISSISITGSPNNFDKLLFRIKDDGTTRTIAWGTSFVAMGTPLPSATVAGKILTVGFIYDSISTKWGCVVTAQQI
jgi:hypothetical protein